VRQASREATPPAVRQALRAVNDPESVALINQLMHQPGVRRATHDLGVGLVNGLISGLSDEQQTARIREMAQGTAADLTATLAGSMQRELAPAVRQVAASAAEGAMRQALSEPQRMQAAAFASDVTRATVAAMVQELGPALRDSVSPELRDALSDATRQMAREAVIGAQEGMAEYRQQNPGGLLARGVALAQWIAVLLALVIAALGLWLYKLTAQARRGRAEAKRREAAMLVLAEAIRATEGKPGSRELLDEIQRRLGGSEQSDYLRRILRTDPDIGARPSFHH
jgi:hypothetical protein